MIFTQLFLLTFEIVVVYTLTVCAVIAILTYIEWVIEELKEEVRTIELQEMEEENGKQYTCKR